MSKIKNIAVLDVRDVQEEVARGITELENIGILIENNRSQILLKDAKKVNIAQTLKLNDDIKLIMQNGSIKIDNEYLEGIITPILILVNGSVEFKNDIDNKLLDEKVHSILVNGEIICPKKLSGIIQSKGTINGVITNYSSNYLFLNGKVELTDKFLKSIKKDSKLSFKKLLILEDIEESLLQQKISNIEILNKLVVTEDIEDKISQYIDDYYSVKKIVIDNKEKMIKYIDDDVTIDDISIKKYEDNVLYVDGRVKIDLTESIDFNRYINLVIANKVACDEKVYEMIKDSIGEGVEVELTNGRLLENMGKMTLTGKIEKKIKIKNMGKLVLDEGLDYDSFTENVISIINYGAIEVPENKLNILEDKVEQNLGKIKTAEESKKEDLERDKGVNNILYTNMGELKL